MKLFWTTSLRWEISNPVILINSTYIYKLSYCRLRSKVYGVPRLRVVDTSMMPTIVSGGMLDTSGQCCGTASHDSAPARVGILVILIKPGSASTSMRIRIQGLKIGQKEKNNFNTKFTWKDFNFVNFFNQVFNTCFRFLSPRSGSRRSPVNVSRSIKLILLKKVTWQTLLTR